MLNDTKNALSSGSAVSIDPSLFSSDLGVMLLGPHPDDFDAVALTLKYFMNNGNNIDACVLRTGSGIEESYCPGSTYEEKKLLREEEQRASCAFFGLGDRNLHFLDAEEDSDLHPLESPSNQSLIGEKILALRPQIVLLPHGNDTNLGHKRVYSMFKNIVNNHALVVAALLIRDPKTIGSRIDLYTPFRDDEAVWKRKLLLFHDTQHQRNLNTRGYGFDDRILKVNSDIAQELSLDAGYAEAFEIEFFNV